jgi:heme/copper-type cytochrome/quinol oxidase subunit 2
VIQNCGPSIIHVPIPHLHNESIVLVPHSYIAKIFWKRRIVFTFILFIKILKTCQSSNKNKAPNKWGRRRPIECLLWGLQIALFITKATYLVAQTFPQVGVCPPGPPPQIDLQSRKSSQLGTFFFAYFHKHILTNMKSTTISKG